MTPDTTIFGKTQVQCLHFIIDKRSLMILFTQHSNTVHVLQQPHAHPSVVDIAFGIIHASVILIIILNAARGLISSLDPPFVLIVEPWSW